MIVCVGKARPKVRDLLRMGPGGVLVLDSTVNDPVELYVGDRLIARGELVEAEGATNGELAVRLTEVGRPTAARDARRPRPGVAGREGCGGRSSVP